ncbi:MAG TPA: GDP-mannose 4,6-dehydratase [Blastocatellia bacterium]|jgi:UDP-glucose 4-epimerase|nr:GDP-mannose 4,6-dehydratase [Blastocatellia bacterium]
MLKLAGKSVLVTGGAGFIGSHLVDRIVREAPSNLVVADSLFLGKEENLSLARQAFPSLKFYRQDASDYEAMKRIISTEAVEAVFNLAVAPLPVSLENPRWAVENNIVTTTVVCELLREGYYRTLIHFSSSEAYGSAQYIPMDEKHPLLPSTPYAASKIAGDLVALSYHKTFGVDVAILRPFNNFGPRQNEGAYAGVIPIVIGRALRGEPVIIYGDGEQTRDFIFVREVADAAVRIYEEPATRGQILNIATGHELSINRLARTIFEILDSEVPIRYEACRPGDVLRHCGGADLARRLIGFEPQVTLKDGLAETVAWYRKMLAAGRRDNGG